MHHSALSITSIDRAPPPGLPSGSGNGAFTATLDPTSRRTAFARARTLTALFMRTNPITRAPTSVAVARVNLSSHGPSSTSWGVGLYSWTCPAWAAIALRLGSSALARSNANVRCRCLRTVTVAASPSGFSTMLRWAATADPVREITRERGGAAASDAMPDAPANEIANKVDSSLSESATSIWYDALGSRKTTSRCWAES